MRTMKTLKKRVTCKNKKTGSNIEAILQNAEKARTTLFPFRKCVYPLFTTVLGKRPRRIRIPEVTFIAR